MLINSFENLCNTPQMYVIACLENKNNCVIILILSEPFLTTTCVNLKLVGPTAIHILGDYFLSVSPFLDLKNNQILHKQV